MNLTATLYEAIYSIRDFLFPPSCPGCASETDGDVVLCDNCTELIEAEAELYRQAPRSLPGIDNISILLPYDELTRTLVHSLKYHGVDSLGYPLGMLMARMLKLHTSEAIDTDTLVIPVPLHKNKLRDRGYNQSERLARGFAAFSGLVLADNLIARSKDTGTQTKLVAEKRLSNVSGAFRFTGSTSLAGKHTVLIDDVLTTGSTVIECARVLKAYGAEMVSVCAVASPNVGIG